MKTYPLGIQTFEKIIDKDFLYVDKTREIYHLTRVGGYYFYARPRRFGKSLMLSTIKSLYQGQVQGIDYGFSRKKGESGIVG